MGSSYHSQPYSEGMIVASLIACLAALLYRLAVAINDLKVKVDYKASSLIISAALVEPYQP